MNNSKSTSYARILKTSSMLGGSSLIDVLLRVIRTKILAIQLGPALFGTMSLYMGFIDMVVSVSSLGINQSAVRDIAKAAATENGIRISQINKILHRLVWGTGLLGLIATVSLAYPASWWMFHSIDHVWAISALGLLVLFAQLNAGQIALLSGLRLIGNVAKANILGSLLGTLMAVPLLLWLGEKAVVPFLLAIALGQLLASWWYSSRIKLPKVRVSWRECVTESRGMIRLGFVLMISGIAATISTYLIRVVMQFYLDEASVGIYQSAFTISGIYVGFILKAMSGDYFPHLTSVSEDKIARNQLVNEQAQMAVLLAVPGLVALLLFSDVLINLLYSDRFIGGSEILRWQILGMFGRIISWPMGFILLARADSFVYIWSEIVVAIAHIFFVWVGIKLFGLNGAGMAFAAQYLLYLILIFLVTKFRHNYEMKRTTYFLVTGGTLLLFLAFGTTFFPDSIRRYVIGGDILLISILWSAHGFMELLGKDKILVELDRLLNKIGYKKTYFLKS